MFYMNNQLIKSDHFRFSWKGKELYRTPKKINLFGQVNNLPGPNNNLPGQSTKLIIKNSLAKGKIYFDP